jgi:uncharacterized protein YdaU (DUF1376 family)
MTFKYDTTIWLPLYIGDTLSETQEMSTLEVGALILLKIQYWKKQGPIPANKDKLSRICRLSLDEFDKVWNSISHLFIEKDGFLIDQRSDSEIETAKVNKAKYQERARKGGLKKAENDRLAKAALEREKLANESMDTGCNIITYPGEGEGDGNGDEHA